MIGDRVIYAGRASTIVEIGDPEQNPDYWIVLEHGSGVMIEEDEPKEDERKVFGLVMLTDTQDDEDLVLISRGPDPRPCGHISK